MTLLNAVEFRTQATLFLLAFNWKANRKFANKCATMLKTFRRYDIQYRFQHDAKKKAMSPRIFTDMQRRNVHRSFDRLPIIANNWNCAIRLASQKTSEGNYDLKLCLLTMDLLYGLAQRGNPSLQSGHQKVTSEDEYRQLRIVYLLQQIGPPVTKRRLSYLEACRLYRVSL